MIIGIIVIISLIILLILMLNSAGKSSKNAENKPKVPPLVKGRSYPWFYIKECLYYFPLTTSVAYESDTKESLVEEMIEFQKLGNYEKVIEICDQIIAKDHKFSRAWIDKINAIYNNVLTGKEWNATVSKNIANCCYNYVRSFSNNYDKSINARHSLIPAIIKRTQDVIKYNRANTTETYNFELYNLLVNLYYLMPFNELIDAAYEELEIGKNLDEIQNNQYGLDTIKSLMSHINMLKQRHSVTIDDENVEELKITSKCIVNDEAYATSWIGFNILFPNKLNRVELIFKFFDQRRQEIDISSGNNKKMTELFKANKNGDGYNVVVLGEDRIKYVTIEVYDESKKREAALGENELDGEDNVGNENVEELNNEEKSVEEKSVEEKSVEEKIAKNERKNSNEEVQMTEKTNQSKKLDKPEKITESTEGKETEEKNDIEENTEEDSIIGKETKENVKVVHKVYPSFSGIKEVGMSENYCLFLKNDGKVISLGNPDKSIDTKNWENIEKIYVAPYAAYAIRKDGTITVAGKNAYDSWEYQYIWDNIVKLEPSFNHIVGLKSDGTVVASGDNLHGQCEVKEWTGIVDISASFHTVALDKEGNVYATGSNNFGECDVSNWSNIEKIATGPFFTVGLRDNGTVVAVGLNSCGQCNTSDWKDVKEIYVRGNVTVGLKYDGTVLVTGRNSYRFEDAKKWKNIEQVKIVNDRIIGITSEGKINYIGKPYWGRVQEEWHNIVSVEANSTFILGKKENGSLICNKPLFGLYMPDNYENFEAIEESTEANKVVVLDKEGKIDLYNINNFDFHRWDTSKFNNIKQISLSKTHLLGLKYDGTAVVTGDDISLAYEVSTWKNLIKVQAGEKFALGLTIDGRVFATGTNNYGQCDVGSWIDVIDIIACGSKAIGLKSDGTVLATGYLEYDEEDFVKEAKNIVGIAMNSKQIMLLDNNGNVSLSYNPVGEDKNSVLEWRNIIKIAANKDKFVGLKSDKTIEVTGKENFGEWENISDIKASGSYIIGIIKINND